VTEPNRLRDEAALNAYRTGSASIAAVAARPRSIGSRLVFIAGVALAIIGIPFFFGPELFHQEVGLGLICLGAGIAVLVIARVMIRNAVAAARHSKLAVAGSAIFELPHLLVLVVVGCGLIGFAALMFAAAFGII
jgi:hypothetical protein